MSTAAALRGFLNKALADLADGKPQEGERLAKAVSALVKAERELAEFAREQMTAAEMNDPEALRAELRRRLSLFADADGAGRPVEALARVAATGVAE